MRKFRNAAVAGMTAVTLVASLNAAAFADPTGPEPAPEDTQKSAIEEGTAASERPGAFEDPNREERETLCSKKLEDLAKEGKLLKFEEAQLGDLGCRTDAFEDDFKKYIKNPTNSSVWGKRYDATQDVYGIDLLGQDKNFDSQPVWSQIWFVVTILGVIGSVIGLGYLPIMNQLKAMGFII